MDLQKLAVAVMVPQVRRISAQRVEDAQQTTKKNMTMMRIKKTTMVESMMRRKITGVTVMKSMTKKDTMMKRKRKKLTTTKKIMTMKKMMRKKKMKVRTR